MLQYVDTTERLYAISRLPLDELGWGRSEQTILRLCATGNKAVTIWVPGYITSHWFFNPQDGEPNSKVSVGVAPLTEHAMGVARQLLENFSQPKAREWHHTA